MISFDEGDRRVLDVDVGQEEVLPGVLVEQIHQHHGLLPPPIGPLQVHLLLEDGGLLPFLALSVPVSAGSGVAVDVSRLLPIVRGGTVEVGVVIVAFFLPLKEM